MKKIYRFITLLSSLEEENIINKTYVKNIKNRKITNFYVILYLNKIYRKNDKTKKKEK
jgi:hypothetical protein